MEEHYMARGGCRAKAFMRLQGHSGWDLSPSNDHIHRDQRMQVLQNNVLESFNMGIMLPCLCRGMGGNRDFNPLSTWQQVRPTTRATK